MADNVLKSEAVTDDDTVEVFGTKDLFSDLASCDRTVAEEDCGDDDWEVLEVTPKSRQRAEPPVVDDFFFIEGASGGPSCNCSDGDQATPRQLPSDDDAGKSARAVSELRSATSTKPVQNEVSQVSNDSTASTAVEDELYRCAGCGSMLFKTSDVVSSSYHAQTSPGYLLSKCENIATSSEKLTAFYTTGRYTIQEVTCQNCSAVLGVTYAAAAESVNQFKVGKLLVGRDRLTLPRGAEHPMEKAKK